MVYRKATRFAEKRSEAETEFFNYAPDFFFEIGVTGYAGESYVQLFVAELL